MHAEFRAYIASAVIARLANSSLIVMIGYHLYTLTSDPLTLGWLGLAQAVPAISLVLYGGVIADRHSRRTIVLIGRGCYAGLTLLLALGTFAPVSATVAILYATGFLLGCAGAFTSPAVSGLEGEIVPAAGAIKAVSIMGSASQAAGLAGPVLGSMMFDFAGPGFFYVAVSALFVTSQTIIAVAVRDRPAAARSSGDGALTRIAEGIRYVAADQVLVGSMALDLFAVFFGGATALLPVFATDVLHVGPTGFGLLRAAISVGSLLAMLAAVRRPPRARAGLALFISIAGFGMSIIVFALSTSFVLSLLALAAVGACDGVSMVVRQAILRLIAPGPMRGRISAVRSVFINSSNELGDFESGMLAGVVGAVAAVWLGGVMTLVVVGITAVSAPRLLKLDLGKLERDQEALASQPVN